MNLLIDVFGDRLLLHKNGTKKVPTFDKQIVLDREINNYKDLLQVLESFLDSEDAKLLQNDQNNSIMLLNFGISYGLISLPKLSKSKALDIFHTRFRLYFPSYEKYYLDQMEYSRSTNEISYYYVMLKREATEQILEMFKNKGIIFKSVDYLAHHYLNIKENKAPYPTASLFIGRTYSELTITNGDKVISISQIEYGQNILLDGDIYLNSPYNFENDSALKFAEFAKRNITEKQILNDENIKKTELNTSLLAPQPKELRILKDNALNQYKIRNNIRKFVSMIEDILGDYAKTPWFLPIKEVDVYSSDDFFNKLIEYGTKESSITFNKQVVDVEKLLTFDIQNNNLFTNKIKSARRKIDWAKFFSMEIGKKKKA